MQTRIGTLVEVATVAAIAQVTRFALAGEHGADLGWRGQLGALVG